MMYLLYINTITKSDRLLDGNNLANRLIQSGHARTYDGGKRLGWCE